MSGQMRHRQKFDKLLDASSLLQRHVCELPTLQGLIAQQVWIARMRV